jgi:hypothetical protein
MSVGVATRSRPGLPSVPVLSLSASLGWEVEQGEVAMSCEHSPTGQKRVDAARVGDDLILARFDMARDYQPLPGVAAGLQNVSPQGAFATVAGPPRWAFRIARFMTSAVTTEKPHR